MILVTRAHPIPHLNVQKCYEACSRLVETSTLTTSNVLQTPEKLLVPRGPNLTADSSSCVISLRFTTGWNLGCSLWTLGAPSTQKKKKKKKEYLYIFTLTVPYYQDLPRGEHTEHSAGVKRRRKRVCASPPLPGVQLSIKCKAQYGISSCVLDSAGTEGCG